MKSNTTKSFSRRLRALKIRLTDENERIRLQFFCVNMIMSIVSLLMTAVNALTGWHILMYLTLIFGLLNLINAALAFAPQKLAYLGRILFAVEILSLFTCFLIVGEPEGFSAVWIALLPACGLLLYRMKNGTILSAVMFAILAALFWTPLGQLVLRFEYTGSFRLRFPLLYLAFYVVGMFFELVRSITQKELNLSKEKYRKLSYTDQLTGLGNESFYLDAIEEKERGIAEGKTDFAVVFFDVNGVKATNDVHGHRFGCHLIVTAGKTLPTVFKTSQLFHIGGDEFVAIVEGEDYLRFDEKIAEIDDALNYRKISYEGVDLILSVARGYSKCEAGEKYNDVLQRADDEMYRNKRLLKEKYDIALR